MSKLFIVVAISCILTLHPYELRAETYFKDGYKIELRWNLESKHLKRNMIVFGDLIGGKEDCEELQVDVQLYNKKDKSSTKVTIRVFDYKKDFWDMLRGEKIVYGAKPKNKYFWEMKNIYIKCLKK
jgi:hypothetical protein